MTIIDIDEDISLHHENLRSYKRGEKIELKMFQNQQRIFWRKNYDNENILKRKTMFYTI